MDHFNNYLQLCLILTLNFISRVNNKLVAKSSLRVIGGRLAERDEFPYVVSLEIQDIKFEGNQSLDTFISFCSGSALTSSWVLTAAHCRGALRDTVTCFVRYNHFFPAIKGKVSKVFNFYSYRLYRNDQNVRYDIALLKTEEIMIPRYAKLSALDYTTLFGQKAMGVGHGISNITDNPYYVSRPLQVLTGILSKCSNDRRHGLTIFPEICLMAPCGIKSSMTPGDSGGPLVHSSGIVGVDSMAEFQFINSMLVSSYPKPSQGLFAPVSPVLDWILRMVTS